MLDFFLKDLYHIFSKLLYKIIPPNQTNQNKNHSYFLKIVILIFPVVVGILHKLVDSRERLREYLVIFALSQTKTNCWKKWDEFREKT